MTMRIECSPECGHCVMRREGRCMLADRILKDGPIAADRRPGVSGWERPKRAVELNIQVGGDTWDDVLDEVELVTCELQRKDPEYAQSCHGSPSSYSLVRCEMRAITHDEYMAEIGRYLSGMKG